LFPPFWQNEVQMLNSCRGECDSPNERFLSIDDGVQLRTAQIKLQWNLTDSPFSLSNPCLFTYLAKRLPHTLAQMHNSCGRDFPSDWQAGCSLLPRVTGACLLLAELQTFRMSYATTQPENILRMQLYYQVRKHPVFQTDFSAAGVDVYGMSLAAL
jgi:hypothetical protein